MARPRLAGTLLAAAAALATLGSCIRGGAGAGGGGEAPEAVVLPGAQRDGEPTVRIGLAVGAPGVGVGGGGALRLHATGVGPVGGVPAGATLRVLPTTSGVVIGAGPGGERLEVERLTLVPAEAGGTVRVEGREYAGEVQLFRDRTGVTAVNRVGMEAYLESVVAGEMGRRLPGESEALRAQAVISRTYAMRNMNRWRAQGFDLYATVSDQVYAGAGVRYPLATEAVASTRGQIVTYAGAPIDAFFYSTCGGRTADGTEIFRGAQRSYLRSVSDEGPAGAYCRSSPRFRWTEAWTGPQLQETLRRNLPAAASIPAARVATVRGVRVAERTASGRVGRLAVGLQGGEVPVDGPQVRGVLRSPSGEMLRSNLFTLHETAAGGRVTRLVAEGGGAGHGVGFCQWGAVGRARAGQGYEQMIQAYYPTTTLERLY